MSTRNLYTLTLILTLCQIADGLLTGLGVMTFGIDSEGNPLIYYLMQCLGVASALILTKLAGILIIFILYIQSQKCIFRRKQLATLFRVLIVFYTVVAVCPWLLILC